MSDGVMAECVVEHGIDLSKVASKGIIDRSLDISELMQALAPVDLQGLDPSRPLDAENLNVVGHVNEVGIGPQGFRDIISDVFEIDTIDGSPTASNFIRMFGVNGYETSDVSSEPDMTKGYNMQIAVGEGYSELVLLPKNRALAEALHHAAVAYYHQKCTNAEIKEAVENLASRLGVQAI